MTKETFDYFLNRENIYNAFYSNNPITSNIYNRSVFDLDFKWDNTPQGYDFWINIKRKYQKFYDQLVFTPEYTTSMDYNLIAIFPKDAADQDIKKFLKRNNIKIDHADKTYVYEVSTTFTIK